MTNKYGFRKAVRIQILFFMQHVTLLYFKKRYKISYQKQKVNDSMLDQCFEFFGHFHSQTFQIHYNKAKALLFQVQEKRLKRKLGKCLAWLLPIV